MCSYLPVVVNFGLLQKKGECLLSLATNDVVCLHTYIRWNLYLVRILFWCLSLSWHSCLSSFTFKLMFLVILPLDYDGPGRQVNLRQTHKHNSWKKEQKLQNCISPIGDFHAQPQLSRSLLLPLGNSLPFCNNSSNNNKSIGWDVHSHI